MTERPVDEFTVTTSTAGDAHVVALAGELDMATVGRVRSAIDERPPTARRVVVDLSALDFLDTSGLRLVVETARDAEEQGYVLEIVRGPEAVQRIFRLARLDERLPFVDAPPAD